MGRKRKSGEGTVRLRKDGRWEGRVVIGYDEKGLPRTKKRPGQDETGVPGEAEAAPGDGDRLQNGEGPAGDALRGVAGLLVIKTM